MLGEGHKIGRLHVATLMKRMGIMAIYRRPNTSKPEPGHKIFPYPLRKRSLIPKGLKVDLCPWPGGDGGDAFGVVGEEIPSLAACCDDMIIIVEDGVGEDVSA